MQSRHGFLALAGGAGLSCLGAPALAHSRRDFELDERFLPQDVPVRGKIAPGTIVISPRQRFLFLVTAPGRARRYGVGIGRAGLGIRGELEIARKARWPSWKPTASMIRRDPRYARWKNGMPGGPGNPLGSRALYLYRDGRDTYYRIHGTTEPWTIGQSVSNGCFRMINAHVEELYEMVPVGTKVIVL
jgi:lipoprotein-anchoring transpeptidase ErfK/SrfK